MKTLLLFAVLICTSALLAQNPGTLDKSFGNKGIKTNAPGYPGYVDVQALPDGKLMLGGIGKYKGFTTFQMTRLLSNGRVDTAYGHNGNANTLFPDFTTPDSTYASLHGFVVLPNGKAVAMGVTHKSATTEYKIALVRFTVNGAVDSTFGNNGITLFVSSGVPNVHAIALQSNGNIIIGGELNTDINNYVFHPYLISFTPNGFVNKLFGNWGVVVSKDRGEFNCIAIDADNKIVAGGEKYDGFYYDTYELARYNANGTLDTTFINNAYNTNKLSIYGITSIAIQNDNKPLVTYDSHLTSQTNNFSVVRFNVNGTIDKSFGKNGMGMQVIAEGATAQKILLAGENKSKIIVIGTSYKTKNTQSFTLGAFLLNGAVDSSYGINGKQITTVSGYDGVTTATLQRDGKIVVMGFSRVHYYDANSNTNLIRYYGYPAKTPSLFADSKRMSLTKIQSTALSIYPNPATNYIVVSGLPATAKTTLTITDATGKTAATYNSQGATQYKVFTGKLISGIYYLQIETGAKTEVLKFVKE